MDDDRFHDYLCERLAPRTIQSYISRGHRVERVLGKSLEALFSQHDIESAEQSLRAKKKIANFTDGSLSNCLVVLRQYYDFLGGR